MKIMLNESRRYNSEMEIKSCNKKIQSLQEKISTMKNYSELDWSKQIKEVNEYTDNYYGTTTKYGFFKKGSRKYFNSLTYMQIALLSQYN